MRLLFPLLLLLVGCNFNQETVSTSAYHADGRAKPRIALFPIFDRSQPEARVTWNLAEELTLTFCQLMQNSGQLYLTPLLPSAVYAAGEKLPIQSQWLKTHAGDADFLVVLELLNHDCDRKQITRNLFSPPNELHMAMRVEVIDMRGKMPKKVLHEVIRKSTSLKFEALQTSYEEEGVGSYLYAMSPIGLAHRSFISEIEEHIEEYVLLAKTHEPHFGQWNG